MHAKSEQKPICISSNANNWAVKIVVINGKMMKSSAKENSCDLNTTINWEKEIGTTALHMKQESSSSELVELRTRPPCLSYLSVPVLSCMRVMSTFLRLVLMEEVFFLSPRKLLKLSAVACLRSLFLFARGAFLMILLVYVFVCLSSLVLNCVSV